MNNVDTILQKQRDYFLSGETIDVKFRIRMLKKLYDAIKRYEKEIEQALFADLNKPSLESYFCEIGTVYGEIKYMIKNVAKLARRKKRKTPITLFGSKSYTQYCPYGNVLIVSPWNYPFLLTFDPLVHAIATGNTAILKPSAYSANSNALIRKIISEIFDEKYVACVEGGRERNVDLFDKKFDFVFFTGSSATGREVSKKCAQNLTPTLLELGGKSPCIVDSSANISLSAKRIVFGKFMNAGQTCVAPDYVLCDNTVKDRFIEEVVNEIVSQYGENPIESKDYGKIINRKHFDRISSLIDQSKVVCGGKIDEVGMKIEPTVMNGVAFDDPVMQEEIFGPILPIIGYDKFEDALSYVRSKSKPLALYLFTEDDDVVKYVTEEVPYGGGCVNDTVVHLSSMELGFGGVGDSGMGSYHGKEGFAAFSHKKSMVINCSRFDISARFRPYNKKKEKVVRKFLK